MHVTEFLSLALIPVASTPLPPPVDYDENESLPPNRTSASQLSAGGPARPNRPTPRPPPPGPSTSSQPPPSPTPPAERPAPGVPNRPDPAGGPR